MDGLIIKIGNGRERLDPEALRGTKKRPQTNKSTGLRFLSK
jgi:hypothetical protein